MKELLQTIEISKTPIRFAYFDLGGVVFNFSGGLEQISKDFNISLEDVRVFWKSRDDQICLGQLTPQAFWQELVAHFGVGMSGSNFLDMWIDHFEPVSETHEVMKKLQGNGVQLGLLTNIYPGVYEKAMEKGVIPQLPYHAVIQSCEVGLVKPDTGMFEIALQSANVQPAEIIFVDDRSENTDMASSLGWNVHLFQQAH
jgi:putative hydrolase of the HAD superfamily